MFARSSGRSIWRKCPSRTRRPIQAHKAPPLNGRRSDRPIGLLAPIAFIPMRSLPSNSSDAQCDATGCTTRTCQTGALQSLPDLRPSVWSVSNNAKVSGAYPLDRMLFFALARESFSRRISSAEAYVCSSLYLDRCNVGNNCNCQANTTNTHTHKRTS